MMNNIDADTHSAKEPTSEEIQQMVTLIDQGCYTEAEAGARRQIVCFPQYGLSWKILGAVLKLQGRTVESLEFMQKAALLLPFDAGAQSNVGVTFTDLGRLVEAEACFRRALEIDPGFAEAASNLGNSLKEMGRMEEAAASYRRALQIMPDLVEAHNNLGNTLKDLGRLEEAEASYRHALEITPNLADAHYNLGITLNDLGRLEEAEASFLRVLEITPDYAEAYNNLGVTLKDLDRLEEAEASYRRALIIKPDFADAHYNMGITLKDLGRLEEAEASYRLALEIKPDFAGAHSNLGMTLKELGRLLEAEASYRRALQINPDCADTCCNLSTLLLSLGQFEEGWQRYESRYAPNKTDRIPTPLLSFPQWQGESLAGKTLLVLSEQGLGDSIQFCRYMPLLKKQGVKHITLQCKKSLKTLLDTLEGVGSLVTEVEADSIPLHDYWTLLLSIPLHCKTRIDTIPAEIPYLSAKQDMVQSIEGNFAGLSGLKVGVCWKTSTPSRTGVERSPGIDPFKKLFRLDGAHFFTIFPESRNELVNAAGAAAVDLGYDLEEFAQTAALIVQLDLVISCDTAVVHLAGALGKPVWVVLPPVPDWRWLSVREDSPWYPTVRLFRQAWPGDWEELFDRVASRLQTVIKGKLHIF